MIVYTKCKIFVIACRKHVHLNKICNDVTTKFKEQIKFQIKLISEITTIHFLETINNIKKFK